ncbi:MAG TPA: type II toxin-antitoxin system prevent-host-death family antitoxin [Polyangia bacterium]|jgi:prevent-host-death family protein
MASRIQAAKARKDFAAVIDRSAKGERIKLTRYGKTLAVVVSKADLEALEDCEKTVEPNRSR